MADQWFYTERGQQAGPVSELELRQLAAAGRLQESDLVWREGMPQWSPVTTVPGLLPEPAARAPAYEPRAEPRPRYAERDEYDRRDQPYRYRGGGEDDDEPGEGVPRRKRRQRGMSTG